MSRIKAYKPPVPKHLTKLSKFGGQYRITIPKLLVEEMAWQDVKFVIMTDEGGGLIGIRRFIDGESLKSDPKTDPPGPD